MQLGMEMDAIGAELKGIAGASTEAFVSPSYLGPECLLTKCYRLSLQVHPFDSHMVVVWRAAESLVS